MKLLIVFLLSSALLFTGSSPADEPALSAPRSVLRTIYTAETGVREASNRNDGPRVEEYLRYVRLKPGNPWCCAFVCYCLGQAGIPNPRTGYCPNLFPKDKVIWIRNSQPPTRNPLPGDIFGLYFPEKGRIAHVGFIDQWDEKWLITVEGNTNESGSREGDGVYKKRRLISSIYKVSTFIPPG